MMRTLKTTLGISTFIVPCLLISSCSDEMSGDILTNGDEISFAAYSDDSQSTRSAAITMETLESFNVSAYYYSGTWDETTMPSQPNFIRNEMVTPNGDKSLWTTDNTHFWPTAGGNMRFYAFANFPDDMAFTSSYTQFAYSVPTSVGAQKDIIATVSDVETETYRTSKNPVPMQFHHLLTAVKFATAGAKVNGADNTIDQYKLKSIGLENIYGSGTFSLKDFSYTAENTTDAADLDFMGNRDAMWSSVGTPTSCTIGFNGLLLKSSLDLTDGDTTMMLIPQSFSADSNAFLVVVLEKDGEEITVIHSLTSQEWGMGQMITYSIYALDTTLGITYQVCPWATASTEIEFN